MRRDASLSQSIARLLCFEGHRSICLQCGRKNPETRRTTAQFLLEPVVVAAATSWIVIDKVRCVQLIDHFRLTFLPSAFNPSARDRVYLCLCSRRHHSFLPNASPADDVQVTQLTLHGIFGSFMVGPRVAHDFRSLA